MKANQTPEDDTALRGVLRQWKVETPLPPRFQEQVWQRIARAEAQASPKFWTTIIRWVEIMLPRPKFAVAYVSAVLILGVAAGSLAAQAANRRLNADLGQRYVASLDPYHPVSSAP
jgi:hypothetical protein